MFMSDVFEVVKGGKEEQRVRDESKWVVSIKCEVMFPLKNRCSNALTTEQVRDKNCEKNPRLIRMIKQTDRSGRTERSVRKMLTP